MGRALSIVFVTNNYVPYSGGVVSSIHAFYDELEKQGHNITIITLDFLGKNHQDKRNVIRINCPIKFKYNQNHIAVPFFVDIQIKRELSKLNPDIVHIHHPFLLGPSACSIAKKMGKPVVFTYHTLYEKYIHYIPLPAIIIEPIILKFVQNFCAKIDTIITPSTIIKEIITKQGVITPTIVLPSPIESLFFNGIQCAKSVQSTRFKLLTVSRFTKEKNIPFLLDMFSQLNFAEYELRLIGYGNELTILQNYAYSKLGLSEQNIRFIVKPLKEELLQYYQDADLFIYASQTETQGLVMLEAMACGLPVVSLYGPGQQDFVHNNKNGYLVEDSKTMIEKIENLSKDKKLLQQLKKDAYQTAQNYTPFQLTSKLIELYRSLIKT